MKLTITAAAAVLAAAVLAACGSSAVSGTGSRQGASGGTDTGSHGGGFGSATNAPATTAAPSFPGSSAPASTSAPTQHGRALVFQGTNTGNTYAATVWDSDNAADCAAHAYGAKMIAFLNAHPCRGLHRVLATLVLQGRTVAVSIISTGFAGTAQDPYGVTAQFKKLEEANGTGSINDLLREGGALPGVSGGIPSNEAFTVLVQDNGAQVFDAWYVDGPTKDQDPALVSLEEDLFLSQLSGA